MKARDWLAAIFGAAAVAWMLAQAVPKNCDPDWWCLYLWICACWGDTATMVLR